MNDSTYSEMNTMENVAKIANFKEHLYQTKCMN